MFIAALPVLNSNALAVVSQLLHAVTSAVGAVVPVLTSQFLQFEAEAHLTTFPVSA